MRSDLSPAQQMQAKVRFRRVRGTSSGEPNSTDTTSPRVRPTRFARQMRVVSTPSGGNQASRTAPLSTSTNACPVVVVGTVEVCHHEGELTPSVLEPLTHPSMVARGDTFGTSARSPASL